MLAIPHDLQAQFASALQAEKVADSARPYYSKWLLFYLDFCRKYQVDPDHESSLAPFLDKLRERELQEWQQKQAIHAVSIYRKLLLKSDPQQVPPPTVPPSPRPASSLKPKALVSSTCASPPLISPYLAYLEQTPPPPGCQDVAADFPPQKQSDASWRKEFVTLEESIRVRHYSRKTLQNYRHWLRKFQAFTRSKPPDSLAIEDVKGFLSWLAVKHEVAASTQNQAFNALLFFFRHVLGREFGKVDGVIRAKRRPYIPVVLNREEIDLIVSHLAPPYDLVVKLLYGCGLRLFECLNLRLQCLNFEMVVITVHDLGRGRTKATH